MGNSLSQLNALQNSQKVSDVTKEKVMELFYVLRANPKVGIQKIEGLLSIIPKNENILAVTDSSGYNILQKAVSLNHVEIVRWILTRSIDINRGACSLPLHIACLKGYKELVELMVNKHKARVDLEFRMCWPGPHHINCEQRTGNCLTMDHHLPKLERSSERLQNAICYAIDGDHPEILQMLLQCYSPPWSQKRPLLHISVERSAFACFQYLISERPEEINQMYDEYAPIHIAVLCQDVKFVERLLSNGALPTVTTTTENMTSLHVLFYRKKGSSEDALHLTKLLLEAGLKHQINVPDSLGNTILHTIIIRYALEESRFSFQDSYTPWTKWDVMHLVRYLLSQGARPSINQQGNSALACVLRHVKNWEFRYELLSFLLQEGGDPNLVGRDGSVPLMVCLVPLINKDLLHNFTHTMKVFYLNCVRILCKHGAHVNCSSRTHLTPLQILVFAASEYMGLMVSEEKYLSFAFIRQLLEVLLIWGLNPNADAVPNLTLGGSRTQHILLSLVDLINLIRNPSDLDFVYELTLTVVQHGADVDVDISMQDTICHSQSSFYLKKSCQKVLYYYVMVLCKKEHLLLDPEKRFAKIIRLYANTMRMSDLLPLLKLLHTQSAIVPVRTSLCTVLKSIYSNPRTLQQSCRVVIYRNLSNRNMAKGVGRLGLPGVLGRYLLGFE